MGIVVSSPTPTSPFFLTTGIIGLVSFAFTVSTFLKVVWSNLETLSEAEHEVHTYLTNLRSELLEEKASLRSMRRLCRQQHPKRAAPARRRHPGLGPELDEVSLKTMNDILRHLIRRFKQVERPFLGPGEQGIQEDLKYGVAGRRGSVSPYYAHGAYNGGGDRERSRSRSRSRLGRGEKGRAGGGERDDEDAFWAQRTSYGHYGVWRRFVWLYKKPEAQQLARQLERVQIRRIAQQIGGLSMRLHDHSGTLFDMEDMVRRIDDRMSRFVGVRRISGGDAGGG